MLSTFFSEGGVLSFLLGVGVGVLATGFGSGFGDGFGSSTASTAGFLYPVKRESVGSVIDLVTVGYFFFRSLYCFRIVSDTVLPKSVCL